MTNYPYRFIIVLFFIAFISPKNAYSNCIGTVFNPITDVCWKCLFPIKLGGINLTPFSDAEGTETVSNSPIGWCGDPPKLGIKVSFWEPARLVEVVREPFCFPSLGGLKMDIGNWHGPGHETNTGNPADTESFYQTHYMIYPVFYLLELFWDMMCLEQMDFDLAYMTDLDPMWNNDELSAIINPEAVLFGSPAMQAVCAADSVAAAAGFPLDPLFWCAGQHGSMYPFSGTNLSNFSPVQSSSLMVDRTLAKLHRELLLWGSVGEDALCEKYPMPIIKKSQYKIQLAYPKKTKPLCCNPIGRPTILYEAGATYPVSGEDFTYVIWKKRDCLLNILSFL